MRIPAFYCPNCKRFKKFYQVTNVDASDFGNCKHCGTECYDTKFLLEKLFNEYFSKIEEENNLEPVKHGHWILCKNYFPDGTEAFVCSLCGRAEAVEEPYCNCGAKMDEKISI